MHLSGSLARYAASNANIVLSRNDRITGLARKARQRDAVK